MLREKAENVTDSAALCNTLLNPLKLMGLDGYSSAEDWTVNLLDGPNTSKILLSSTYISMEKARKVTFVIGKG